MKRLYYFFKINVIFLLILQFSTSNSSAVNNNFCLENDGFIMPIIEDDKECKNIININEFKQLISLNQDQRSDKLKEIRALAKSQPQKKTQLNLLMKSKQKNYLIK